MPADGLQKGLKAAVNQAAKRRSIDFHLADAGGPLNESSRRWTSEVDSNSLDG